MTILRCLLLILALLTLMPASAQDSATMKRESFTFKVPAGWDFMSSNLGIVLTRDAMRITVMEMAADAPEAMIEASLAALSLTPGSLISATDAPLPNGAWKQQIYAAGAQLTVALAHDREPNGLVIVIEGEQGAMQAANPQFLQLLNSIEFADTVRPAYVDKPPPLRNGKYAWAPNPTFSTAHFSMPKGEGPFPAAVLVHGSGPQNRDGTVGPLDPAA